ncbi:MAG TPA: hypothetical protein VGU72_12175 [Beijerinckiaceae bacterium]|nr:hypothetical protein [Beijerinckiaceae bacterium]
MLEWIVVPLLLVVTAVYFVWRRAPKPPFEILFDRHPRIAIVLAVVFCLGVLAVSLGKLYRVFSDGIICSPSSFCMTFDAHPFRFVLETGAAVFGVLMVMLVALIGATIVWDMPNERRRENHAKNAPPLDNAIRRGIDER